MKWFYTVFILLISPSISAETITLCSHDRPGLSKKDGTGYYWDLLRAVYKAEGIKLIHMSAPFKRCLLQVEHKVVDGAVSAFKTPDRSRKFTYPKSRLNFSSYGLVYLKGTSFDKIENVNDRIGIIRGYVFSEWLPSYLRLVELNNNFQAIEMLKLKRIKYHADDLQDVLLTIKKMGEPPDQFVFKTLMIKDLYLPLIKDARGQYLADKFDTGLKKIFKNGTLERLIKEHGIVNSILPDFK
jgi:polar amino acid transport system substrate-binding protein